MRILHLSGLIAGLFLLAACSGASPSGGRVVGNEGQELWGGQGIIMVVNTQGAALEFDCANGRFSQSVSLDGAGRFSVQGKYVQEHGGPINADMPLYEYPAHYSGQVVGQKMTLTITLVDKNQKLAEYVLEQNQPGRIVKCL